MCLACDRDQARIVLNYTRSYFTDIGLFAGMISKETQFGFELSNGIDITVATNSFRSVRGRPVLCAILDEIAFWRDDNSANPDDEVFAALKPGLASLAGFACDRYSVRRIGARDCCTRNSKTTTARTARCLLSKRRPGCSIRL